MKKLFLIIALTCLNFALYAQESTTEDLAYQYYQDGDYEKAAVLLEKLFAKTKSEGIFDLYFNALLKIKKIDEAEKLTKKLLKTNPESYNYNLALAKVYQESGRNAAVNLIFNDLINNLPKNENKVNELANNFYKINAYDQALLTYLKARKLFANNQLFTFELLGIYRFKKDKKMLAEEYISCLATFPTMLLQAQSVLASIFENDTDYQYLEAALFKKIQKEPEVEVYTQLLIWQYIQQKNYDAALRQLLAQNKRTKNDGSEILITANTFTENAAYPTAIKAYQYLIALGPENENYLPAKLNLTNLKYQLAVANAYTKPDIVILAQEYNELLTTFGKNIKTLFAIRRLANLQAYYLNDLKAATATLENALQLQQLSAQDIGQLKLELGDIYILDKQPWEAILVYEQVAKQLENQTIGHEALFRSAKLSFYQGNFNYAKSQLDVLKTFTTQLIANDALNLSLLIADNLQTKTDSLALQMYADAALLTFSKRYKQALIKLDSIAIAYPNNSLTDDVLMEKVKIYMATNEINNAADALNLLINQEQNSIWADDALFTLAEIYATKLNDVEKAKTCYQKLITNYPGSTFIGEARKRFRNLRGDNLGT